MKNNKKTKKKIITVVVIILILGLIVLMSIPKPVEVQVAAVKTGAIGSYIEERAKTSLPHVYQITMPFNGRVKPITLKEGDGVTKGMLVAELDIDNLQTALEQTIESNDAFDKSVAASKTRITSSKAVQEYAAWIAQAQKTLYPAKLVSEMSVKDAEKDSIEAEALSQEMTLSYHAMQALNAAMKLLPIFFERTIKRSKLVSPVDGTVLKRYVSNEQVLAAGQSLLDIGDLETIEISADILSEDAVAIKTGDSVEIYGAAFGAKKLQGTVKRIYPEGFTKLSSLGVEQQRVRVLVTFDKHDLHSWQETGKSLGVGYRVQVRIYTAKKEHTLTIPRTTLFRNKNNNWNVFKIAKGKVELVTVRLGLINPEQAEVTDGLKNDDIVILAPDTSLKPGMRVTYETKH